MSITDNEVQPRIIYIAGFGRSGSTILDILLGNHQDVLSLGEAFSFFNPEVEKQRCSCGANLTQCSNWSKVYLEFVSSVKISWSEINRIRKSVEAIRSFPKLFFGVSCSRFRDQTDFRTYCLLTQNFFTGIHKITSCKVVVDSSKTAWNAIGRPYALLKLCGLDVKIIHLIRDGRGVMWSTMRGSDPELEQGRTQISRIRGYQRAFSWAAINFLTRLLLGKLPKERVLTLHYEDLVDRPSDMLAKIGDFIGMDLGDLIEKTGKGEELKVPHLIRGNRVARQSGTIKLSNDQSWRKHLRFTDHVFFWLTLWPAAWLFRRRRVRPLKHSYQER